MSRRRSKYGCPVCGAPMRFDREIDEHYSILVHPDGRVEEEFYNVVGSNTYVSCSADVSHRIDDEFEEMIRDIGYDHGG